MAERTNGLRFNNEMFRNIRNLPEVRAEVMKRAEAIAAKASNNGEIKGYKVTDLVLEESRAAVSVMATGHAHHDNRKNNTLIRALDAGRGD